MIQEWVGMEKEDDLTVMMKMMTARTKGCHQEVVVVLEEGACQFIDVVEEGISERNESKDLIISLTMRWAHITQILNTQAQFSK